MKPLLRLLPLLLLGAAPPDRDPAGRDLAGSYRLAGEPDVASGLDLGGDGRFRYFLIAGALDERAEGRWSAAGHTVRLRTEPKPVPSLFRTERPTRSAASGLSVKVSAPDGRGIALVDVRIGFDVGAPVEGYTQEDGWSLPAEEKRVPRWIELGVPMHGLASPRFPIDPGSGNALAFTLVPNDIGVVDFDGVRIEREGKALVVHRWGGTLRYEPAGQ